MENNTSILQVILVQVSAVGIYLGNINTILTFVSLSLAISFTCYKFYKEFKK